MTNFDLLAIDIHDAKDYIKTHFFSLKKFQNDFNPLKGNIIEEIQISYSQLSESIKKFYNPYAFMKFIHIPF